MERGRFAQPLRLGRAALQVGGPGTGRCRSQGQGQPLWYAEQSGGGWEMGLRTTDPGPAHLLLLQEGKLRQSGWYWNLGLGSGFLREGLALRAEVP